MNEICPKCKLDKGADEFKLCELCREKNKERNRINQRNWRDRKRGKPPRAYRRRDENSPDS